jgi:gamma-glutamyltranspeptidase/glutathione hydrolase
MIMPYGTPGNDVQPQAMVQFLLGVLDYGLDLQSALDRPRCVTYSFPASSDPHPYRPNAVAAEARVGSDVVDGLRERGHDVEVWPEWTGTAGSVCAARAELDGGVFHAGADPRRQAYAIGR